MTSHRTLTERLVTALAADDLQLREVACNLDKIIVSGWSARSQNLGSLAFWAKYLHDQSKARQFVHMVRSVAVARLRQRRRMTPRHEVHKLADIVVAWWMHDKCPVCQGRGLMVLDQVTSSIECGACHGSGLRRIPKPKDAGLEWDDDLFERRFTDVQMLIDGAVSTYMGGVHKSMHFDAQPAPAPDMTKFVRVIDDCRD